MLFKHHKLIQELREHGRKANAQVLGIKTLGAYTSARAMWADDTDLTVGYQMVRLRLRVMPEGEEPFEKTIYTRLQPAAIYGPGDPIEVLYDPSDHDKVVFDYEEELKRAVAAQKELATNRWDPAKLDSFEEQKLDDLMMQNLKGEISDEELEREEGKIYSEANQRAAGPSA